MNKAVWHHSQIHHESTFFCSSLIKCEAMWLCPEELKVEAKNDFCAEILIKQPNEACRRKCLQIFDVFRSACIFALGSTWNKAMVWWLFPHLLGFFGECLIIRSLPTLFFLNWRLAQSTVAQWAETTVAESSLTSCVWAHFLIGSHTVPGQQHGSPLQLHWVKNVCMLRCNLPPAFWAEWLGSFSCHCSNVGV